NSVKANQIDVLDLRGVLITADLFVGREFHGGTFTGTTFQTAADGMRWKLSSDQRNEILAQTVVGIPRTGRIAFYEPADGFGASLEIMAPLGQGEGVAQLAAVTMQTAGPTEPSSIRVDAHTLDMRNVVRQRTTRQTSPIAGANGFYGSGDRLATKAPDGLVTFVGYLERTAADLSVSTSFVQIGDITAGYRPTHTLTLGVVTTGRVALQMTIGTDGRISIRNISNGSTSVTIASGTQIQLAQIPPYYAAE